MKKLFILLLVLAGIVGFTTACSDDNGSDTRWKQIPSEEISGADLSLTLNGAASALGSAQIAASSAAEGVLTLRNVVAGYAEVAVPVALSKQQDGSYNYSGKVSLGAPSVTRSEQTVAIFEVSAQGNVSLEGKVSSAVVTSLTKAGQGDLSGTWPMSKDFYTFDENGFPENMLPTTPFRLTWSALDAKQPNGGNLAIIGTTALSHILSEVLSNVTLGADGNLTASYYPELITSKVRNSETGEWMNMSDYMEEMGATEMFDEMTYWFMLKILNGYTIDPYDRQWLSSPKNLVTWYVSGDNFYIIPNLAQILAQVASDQGGSFDPQEILAAVQGFREMDDETLKQTIVLLGNGLLNMDLSGIDVALVRNIFDWLETGVPLKYSVENGALKLYVDKEMAKPYMDLILTFMPLLDEKFQEIAAADETGMMGMVFLLLGFEKFTDLQTIWADNTDTFELGLCFKNAASPASLKRTGMNAARQNPVKWTDLGAVKQHLRIK